MSLERERVRAMVREELLARLAPRESSHPALVEIVVEADFSDDVDYPASRPCLIEPDRPCYHSGYCKRMGY